MPKDAKQYLEDILQAIRDIEQYTANAKDSDEFSNSAMRVHAILYNMEIIGEAAKNIPGAMKKNILMLSGAKWRGCVILWRTNTLVYHWKLSGESSGITCLS